MKIILVLILIVTAKMAMAVTVTKDVVYGDGKFEGFVTENKDLKGKRPTILMVHNWAGITEETKTQALRFAELGYVVFGVDVYGKGIRPTTFEDKKANAMKLYIDRKLFRKNLEIGFKFLSKKTNVDKKKIAVLGYCLGGTGALELARNGTALKGAISFHGGLDSPNSTDGKKIRGKVLVLHGALDPNILGDNAIKLADFEKEMNENKVPYRMIKFDNAVHSFTDKSAGADPSKGSAYNEAADNASFDEATKFLKDIFK